MKYKLKPSIKRFLKLMLLLVLLLNLSDSTVFLSYSFNFDNLKKEVGFVADAIKEKQEEPKPVEKKEVKKQAVTPVSYDTNSAISSSDDGLLYGSLTGYSADCPLCGGTLACTKYDVYKNGVVTYPDATYGEVRIVASSKKYPCGSILAINSSLTSGPMLAIVLDRGVGGNNLDLLVTSEAEAYANVGRRKASFTVLRSGW